MQYVSFHACTLEGGQGGGGGDNILMFGYMFGFFTR